jgi:hypothetical protein
LRLVDLRLVGTDLGLLHNDLRIDILDIGPSGGDLSLSLSKWPATTCSSSVTGTAVR